ncbi:MAG: 4Fe-4S binding protein [Nitrososphaerota archaeon]|nr:4Fe-4S binding protein [Candidatus Bathyarchaeota archaeon]MDW8048198.1 4Fe-4S binding protein [Nitrososphaerota archaeon]
MRLGRMLRVALGALLQKPVTVRYLTKHGEKVPIPDRYRGKIIYDKDACIGCLLCIRTCPSGVITATEDKKVRFDISRCIFCGQCEETCPKKAISLGSEFELLSREKEELIIK